MATQNTNKKKLDGKELKPVKNNFKFNNKRAPQNKKFQKAKAKAKAWYRTLLQTNSCYQRQTSSVGGHLIKRTLSPCSVVVVSGQFYFVIMCRNEKHRN